MRGAQAGRTAMFAYNKSHRLNHVRTVTLHFGFDGWSHSTGQVRFCQHQVSPDRRLKIQGRAEG